MFYTYAHYTPEGRLFYIGKGSLGRYKTTCKRSLLWKSFVEKYGSPRMEILANWKTEAEALDHEKLLISCFKDMGYELANQCSGGKGNSGYKLTTEQKNKISTSLYGNKYSIGYDQYVEHRKKNSIAQIGNKRALGNKHTGEFKKKISECLKGNKNALGGFKWIGTHQKTKEVITFFNTTALNKSGFQHANIIKCINVTRKSHKGYSWSKEKWEDKSWD